MGTQTEITPIIQVILGLGLLVFGILIFLIRNHINKKSDHYPLEETDRMQTSKGNDTSKDKKDKKHKKQNKRTGRSVILRVLYVIIFCFSGLIIVNAICYYVLFHFGITIYSSVSNDDALILLVTTANLAAMVYIAIIQYRLQQQVEENANTRSENEKKAHINELVAQTLSAFSVEGFRARLLNLNIRECSPLQSREVLDYNRDSAPLMSIDLGQGFNHIGYLELDFLVGIIEHEKKYICVRPKSFPTEKQDKIVLLMDRKNIVDGALILSEQLINRVLKLNQDNQVEQDSECFNNILLAPFETDHKSKEVTLHLWIKVKDTRYTNKEMYPFLISISLKLCLQNYNRYGCCKAALTTYNLQIEDIYYSNTDNIREESEKNEK